MAEFVFLVFFGRQVGKHNSCNDVFTDIPVFF